MKKQKKDRIVFRMGKRIYIRPVLTEDLGLITIWINDPDINQFLKISVPQTPEDEAKWLQSLMTRKGQDVVFAIVLEKSDDVIGIMGLHRIDQQHGLAFTGSFIGRKELWGKGYGYEAKMLVLEYAFNTLNLRKICSSVYDFNLRSKRCLEKCGYVTDGIRKAHRIRNGRSIDEIGMAVFRDGFMAKWKIFVKEVLGKKETK